MRKISSDDHEAIRRGEHTRLYEILGAHPVDLGFVFRVWAPEATSVSVIGEFNDWDPQADQMVQTPHFGGWGGEPGRERLKDSKTLSQQAPQHAFDPSYLGLGDFCFFWDG